MEICREKKKLPLRPGWGEGVTMFAQDVGAWQKRSKKVLRGSAKICGKKLKETGGKDQNNELGYIGAPPGIL